jgi:hypothetical protein
MSCIPYIVCTAHPDYKRPRVSVSQNQTTRETLIDDLTEAYFNALVDELYYSEEYHGELTQENLDKFFENYYREHYMDNSPLDMNYFMDGEWHYFDQPPIEVLSEKYKELMSEYQED